MIQDYIAGLVFWNWDVVWCTIGVSFAAQPESSNPLSLMAVAKVVAERYYYETKYSAVSNFSADDDAVHIVVD